MFFIPAFRYGASRAALDGGGAAATFPLDGLTPTGAWSFSRKLFSAYGGDLYRDDGGGVADILYDQSGNTRNFTESSIGPVISTFGPNNRTCGDFDANTDFMNVVGGPTLATFIDNNSAYIVISCVWDTLTANNASSFNNHGAIGDSGGFIGIYGKSGGIVHAQNWDGSDDNAAGTIVAGTGAVVSLRHEGGNLYVTVNGTESAPTTSGNTTTLTGTLRLGRANNGSTIALDGKVIECAIFDTVPVEATRQAIEADFKTYAGF